MTKIFAFYCAALLAVLAYANYQGYVFSNIFSSESHAAKSANSYHK